MSLCMHVQYNTIQFMYTKVCWHIEGARLQLATEVSLHALYAAYMQ